MKSDARPVAIIVGGGFSGTMAAAELARRGLASLLVEGGGRAGRGTAYSTREVAHLLNVPAAKMSAWADAPDDFVAQGHDASEFVPRMRFGEYLASILDEAVEAGLVKVVAAQATGVRRVGDSWAVTLDDGRELTAPSLVLAQGNQAPEPMAVSDAISGTRFVTNPWSAAAAQAAAGVARSGGDVLILGTGLTMVDMVLSLDAAGHQGRIVALSRRGQVPRGHAPYDPAPVGLDEVPLGSVSALWRWLRRRAGTVSWRAAVDAVRPHSHAIWRALDLAQRRRFLRHARPWWDVHRHRIAPQVAERLKGLIMAGRLDIVAGRLTAMRESAAGLEVAYRRRHSSDAGRTHMFAAAFNCTGPLGSMARTRDPLLRDLIDQQIVAIDGLGMGLAIEGAGRAGPGLWALGPLAKGALWEIVAVPDIREQVAAVAEDIARERRDAVQS